MIGKRMPETCWAVFEWRAINLGDCCIWLVDLFEWVFSPFALHTVDKENFATRITFTYLWRIWKKNLQNVNLLCWTALPAHKLRIAKGNVVKFSPLNAELNPICYLLALLGAHHFLHVSRIRIKSLTLRQLMSYMYGAPILDVSRSHTTTHHSR